MSKQRRGPRRRRPHPDRLTEAVLTEIRSTADALVSIRDAVVDADLLTTDLAEALVRLRAVGKDLDSINDQLFGGGLEW